MYTKKYIIKSNSPIQSGKVYEYHTVETEVEFDGDKFFICQRDADTGCTRNLIISEDDARDLADIINEIIERGE